MPTTRSTRGSDWSKGARPKPNVPVGPVTATARGRSFMDMGGTYDTRRRRVARSRGRPEPRGRMVDTPYAARRPSPRPGATQPRCIGRGAAGRTPQATQTGHAAVSRECAVTYARWPTNTGRARLSQVNLATLSRVAGGGGPSSRKKGVVALGRRGSKWVAGSPTSGMRPARLAQLPAGRRRSPRAHWPCEDQVHDRYKRLHNQVRGGDP